ncbi:hypothetical protein [Legionella resiliens]|uniref:Uncharacterized protein n=1 Tax=Legionella resiliens TaxID=2905958 RepID=A0ABS8WXJ1_9GAMM|nr:MULTISPECIES: hypothetical protein [unclassified Legionella]MCE0722042.1 hypothetical protein [Legionella sp. 9fVS26]MCE3531196.1 hypothetical protein [Legionella sp. 8cVS16]
MRSPIESSQNVNVDKIKICNEQIFQFVIKYRYLDIEGWESRNSSSSQKFQIVSPLYDSPEKLQAILKQYGYDDHPNYKICESREPGQYRIVITGLSDISSHFNPIAQKLNEYCYLGCYGWESRQSTGQMVSGLFDSPEEPQEILKKHGELLSLKHYKVVESNQEPGKYRICISNDKTNQEDPWSFLIQDMGVYHEQDMAETVKWIQGSGLMVLNFITQMGYQEICSFRTQMHFKNKDLTKPGHWVFDEKNLCLVNSGPSIKYDNDEGAAYKQNIEFSIQFGIEHLQFPQSLKKLVDFIKIENYKHCSYYYIPLQAIKTDLKLFIDATVSSLDRILGHLNDQIKHKKLELNFFSERFTPDQHLILAGCFKFYQQVLISSFSPADSGRIIEILLKDNKTQEEEEWLNHKMPSEIYNNLLRGNETLTRLKLDTVDGGNLKNGTPITIADVHQFMKLSFSLTELYCQKKIFSDQKRSLRQQELESSSISLSSHPNSIFSGKNSPSEEKSERKDNEPSPV